jgi:hypothetical protein
MIIAPPTPSRPRAAMSWAGEAASAASSEAPAKTIEPRAEQPPSSDPVAQTGHGDEQPGEDEPVGVDDPQQLDRPGGQVGGQGRERDVEQGGVHGDQQQARARTVRISQRRGSGVITASFRRCLRCRQTLARRSTL